MYFIARNNKVYNYIAHTRLTRCYMATLGAVCAFFLIGMYCIYFPLVTHNALLSAERLTLQKKSEEIFAMQKNDQELTALVESGKKNIADRALTSDAREEQSLKRMQFVLDTVTQCGLILNTYSACAEKDKTWYTKNCAHIDVSGSLQKLMTFLETIKNSDQTVAVFHVTFTRTANEIFHMGCDIGLVTVKK